MFSAAQAKLPGKSVFAPHTDSMATPMKGLVQFISDLRNSRAYEAEAKRVNSELVNIRHKFKDPNLNGYNKKKYVCKLIFIYILGYEVDIGHSEAASLISSSKYSEKQVGYLAVSLMLNENDNMLDMIVNSLRKDLASNKELNTCLALNCIATVGGKLLADELSDEVFKLLISPTSPHSVKKKAALTILRLYRKDPDIIKNTWPDRIAVLIDDEDLGVNLCVASLLLALVQDDPDRYTVCYAKVVRRLQDIILHRKYPGEAVYYGVPCPWLLIKLFRILQNFPPTKDETLQAAVRKVLFSTVERMSVVNAKGNANESSVSVASTSTSNKTSPAPPPILSVNEHNAKNAVLFEAIDLAIHMDVDPQLIKKIVEALGEYLTSSKTNIRYLSLTSLATLAAQYEDAPIRQYTPQVVRLLRDKDISVRRKAIDLLYCLCDTTNVSTIVVELLKYLTYSEYAMREEVAVRIAILAEKFASDPQWYVDVSLQLISIAGNYISDEVWQRVVQIVVNNENLQVYAAKTTCEYLRSRETCPEGLVKCGGYILGEYGHLIADEPECSPIEQFLALHDKFPMCSVYTKGLLLTTYIKFVNLFQEIKSQIIQVFEFYSTSMETELQQRACEYLRMAKGESPADKALLSTIWDEMPPFSERTSALLTRLHAKHVNSDEKRAWALGNKQAQDEIKALKTGSGTPVNTTAGSNAGSNVGTNGNGSRTSSSSLSSTNGNVNGDGHAKPSPPLVPASRGHSSSNASSSVLPDSDPLTSNWEPAYRRLLTQNEGIFYQDSLISISCKSEYRKHLGCVILTFNNISGATIQSLSVEVINHCSDTVLHVSTKNIPDPTLEAGQNTRQVILLECKQPFAQAPHVKISFRVGAITVLHLKLPVVLDKFMVSTKLTPEQYISRWKQLAGEAREIQKIFKNVSATSPTPLNLDDRVVVSGLNWSVVPGVDPNPKNLVGASVIHTSAGGNFGCLYRLEPSPDGSKYRITVRATDSRIPAILAKSLSSVYTL